MKKKKHAALRAFVAVFLLLCVSLFVFSKFVGINWSLCRNLDDGPQLSPAVLSQTLKQRH